MIRVTSGRVIMYIGGTSNTQGFKIPVLRSLKPMTTTHRRFYPSTLIDESYGGPYGTPQQNTDSKSAFRCIKCPGRGGYHGTRMEG